MRCAARSRACIRPRSTTASSASRAPTARRVYASGTPQDGRFDPTAGAPSRAATPPDSRARYALADGATLMVAARGAGGGGRQRATASRWAPRRPPSTTPWRTCWRCSRSVCRWRWRSRWPAASCWCAARSSRSSASPARPKTITQHNLSERLPVVQSGDELERLSVVAQSHDQPPRGCHPRLQAVRRGREPRAAHAAHGDARRAREPRAGRAASARDARDPRQRARGGRAAGEDRREPVRVVTARCRRGARRVAALRPRRARRHHRRADEPARRGQAGACRTASRPPG